MNANTPRYLRALQALYRIHDGLIEPRNLACTKGCSTCCTRQVTLTSLEGFYILESLEQGARQTALERIHGQKHLKHGIPGLTINGMAELCRKGEDVPDEDSDPAWGPCPLLDDGLCTVYPFRPFACRCMVSDSPCGESGLADMGAFLMTVSNVFMQYLEHLDQKGLTANLSDLLPALAEAETYAAYRLTGSMDARGLGFLKNLPLSVLMVPPEHRDRLRPILDDLQKI